MPLLNGKVFWFLLIRSHTPPSDREFIGARSDISNDSIEKNGDPIARFEYQQRRWLAELKARNAKIVQVTYPRTANNDKELTVVRGEYLEVRINNSPIFFHAAPFLHYTDPLSFCTLICLIKIPFFLSLVGFYLIERVDLVASCC